MGWCRKLLARELLSDHILLYQHQLQGSKVPPGYRVLGLLLLLRHGPHAVQWQQLLQQGCSPACMTVCQED